MEKQSKKEKSTFVFVLVITAIFISMSAVYILQRLNNKSGNIAEIYQNGVLVEVINIARSEGYRLTLEDGNGGFNVISVTGGKIGVAETNCPDKTCLRTGFINSGAFPVICLPHKVEIRLIKNTTVIDGISY